ncbi:MAG: VWA domain-containing protein [Anaerolineae bacterium]|uniref:vWA domain-containing protein n=1 Tax=Candidatus Flexifilum breve TaxID=3140694 RepID=UPI001AC569FB|nr:VWA domain-containing protein [Chloroflexota bacterium]MBN8637024.1 VWA domain-containing protein [Anaerolineae bacterium]
MNKRMVEFIRALRAAGVRISLAESLDAMHGVDAVGLDTKDQFRSALKTTLVKEARDTEKFDYYFPLFFGSQQPDMQDSTEGMSPDDQQKLDQAMEALMGDKDALRELLKQLLQGRQFSQDQMDQAAQQSGLDQASDMSQRPWFERRMQRQLNMQQIQQLIEELLQELQQMGMSREQLQELREMLEQNAQGLSDQVSQYVGASLAERMANREPEPKPDLLDVPFTRLSEDDMQHLRDEIRRLAARLRSRAALRQKHANAGTLDPRRVMRANMKYDSVPLELKYKTTHVKPQLVLICDVSTSMRYCAEFLLTLIYELQDQVAKTDSFIFISDIVDISMDFKEHQPMEAVEKVLTENRPGYYNTDLGNSLNTFKQEHMGRVTGRTTVIILGDGRNNYNDPRLDIMSDLHRRSRRLLWFNPEPPSQWGSGDSDMVQYAPLSSGVYKVSNLRELAAAVDKILTDG